MKLGAKELRITKPSDEQLNNIRRRPVYIILDNVLDTYNIGSLFRLADALACEELILCGDCEVPPASRIHKAAIGTEEWVEWRYFKTAKEAISVLRSEIEGLTVVAVEQDKRAVDLYAVGKVKSPVALVVGHETNGVSGETLNEVDVIVEIPMHGVNKSLNVHVSASVAAYCLLDG